MNIKRLKHLSEILRKFKETKDNTFDMGGWAVRTFKPTTKTETEVLVPNGDRCQVKTIIALDEGFCKTSQCVLGHAALDPTFNRQGLKIIFDEPWDESEVAEDYGEDSNVTKTSATVTYRGERDTEAGSAFFGLTDFYSDNLFHGDFRTPKAAAKYIDAMIEDYLAKNAA